MMNPNVYQVEWNGKNYSAIDVTIFAGTKDELNVMVCDTDFEEELLSHIEATDPLQDSAFSMDEKIVYYIEPSEWELSDEEIVKLVEHSYDT